MRIRTTVLLCILALAATMSLSLQAAECPAPGSLTFSSSLNGNQFGGQGSPTGFGTAFLTIDPTTNQATLTSSVGGVGTNLGALSLFQSGSTTPAFTFTDTNNAFTSGGTFRRTVSLTPALLNQLLTNPSNFSLGLATGEYPNGAISGSLTNQRSFSGTFSGNSVVGSTGVSNGGGTFNAFITPAANGSGSVLTYNFMPTGIGNNITGLELRQGGTGTNGSLFTQLSGNATLTNGSLSGSVPLTAAQAQQLMSNTNGYYLVANTTANQNGAVRAQFGATQYEYFFPVAGVSNGALGNQWRTDVQIFNAATTTPANVTMQWLPAGGTNVASTGALNASSAGVTTINAQNTMSLDNAINSIFGTQTTGLGAVRIVSDQPIVAVERIYDSATGAEQRATAQAIYALTRCEAVGRGVIAAVSAGSGTGSNQSLRSNIGFFNPNSFPVTVRLNMNDAQGTSAATQQTITLQPYMQRQTPLSGTNGLFASAGAVTNGAVTFEASGPIFAYSSVVNNANGDTHVTLAKEWQAAAAATVSDAEVAAIITAANQGEITTSQAARPRLSNSNVVAFADQMIAEHSLALTQAQTAFATAGITPTSDGTSTFMTSMAQQASATLNGTASGAALDRAYMQLQVQLHQMTLNQIDMVLLPSAQNAQLRSLLIDMRGHVATHLTLAQQILTQLQ